MSFDQNYFMRQWNLVAEKLRQDHAFKKIPSFHERGVCCGLAFLLADYFKQKIDDDFFKIYHQICTTDPDQLAEWMKDNKNTKQVQGFVDFIYKLFILQEQQNSAFYLDDTDQSSASPKSNNKELFIPIEWNSYYYSFKNRRQISKWIFSPEDHLRIGNQLKIRGITYFRDDQDILNVVERLKPGYSVMFFAGNKEGAHALLVYKNQNLWCAFDPNDGERRVFQSALETAHYLTKRINDCYPPEISLKTFKNWLSSFFNNETKCLRDHLLLVHAMIEPSQAKEFAQPIPQNESITSSQIERIKNKYRNDDWFTFFYSKKEDQILKILDAPLSDQERYQLARSYVEKNPDTSLAQKIKEEVYSLRTKKI